VKFPDRPDDPELVPDAASSHSHLSRQRTKARTVLLGALCLCILLGILGVGLWPFHAPRNDVDWLSEGPGILFGKHGSMVSEGAFAVSPLQAGGSCSIEVWVEPSQARSSGTIFAFYQPGNEGVSFAVRQSIGDLKVETRGPESPATKAKLYLGQVFSRRKPTFFTITSSEKGTAIYTDGALAKKSSNFRFSGRDLAGLLLVGNGPSTSDSWAGQLRGLAMYDRELAANEVARHFTDWSTSGTAGQPQELSIGDATVAQYLFWEGKGNLVHNQVDSGTNLMIPERFFVLHQPMLKRPWDEYYPDWSYWKDVIVNISGFIPLGIFFRAYLLAIGKTKQATWLTIVLGFLVSLTIEVSQAFLPTRDSGMTDVINNTLGTAVGAILCASAMQIRGRSAMVSRTLGSASNG